MYLYGEIWNQVPMQKASVDQSKVITNQLVTITGNIDLFTFHMHVSENTSVKVKENSLKKLNDLRVSTVYTWTHQIKMS